MKNLIQELLADSELRKKDIQSRITVAASETTLTPWHG
jgi:hypothetical protein